MEILKRILCSGIQSNQIVHLENDTQSDLNYSILRLMVAIASDSLSSDCPKEFLVPSWVRYPIKDGALPLVGGTIHGIPIKELPDGISAAFKKQIGELPKNTANLIVLITKDGKIILGAF